MDSLYQLIFGVVVITFLAWILFFHDAETMWPNYNYSSTGQVLNTGMSNWQSVTQGGIPNTVEGRTPDGGYIGKYDYLGKNYSGLNVIPGDFATNLYYHQGYKDCGCGCDGQKKADVAVALASPTATAGLKAANSTATPKAVEKYVSSRAMTYTLPNYMTNPSSNTPYERSISNFGNAPMSSALICSKGIKGTVGGRCKEGFGPNQNAYAQTVATVGNSGRAGTRSGYFDGIPLQSDMLKYTEEVRTANASIASALASNMAMANVATAIAMDQQLLTEIPPINAHQDAPLNGPRRPIMHADLGKYEGQNIISAFDGRGR